MTRPMLRQWFGTAAVVCMTVLGCNHAQHHQVQSTRRYTPAVTVLPSYMETKSPVCALPPAAPAEEASVERAPAELPAAQAVKPESEARQASYAPPPPPVQDKPFPRRSFADVTARPCFAHSNDYSQLTGELQYVHVRNAWKIRYASVDEEDRYGGSVTLTETGPMTKYSNGQLIRVEGRLADPESRESSPAFRVRSIQLLTNP